jgi:general stress protein YciG
VSMMMENQLMAGTKSGGFKAAATNKQRYGLNFYEQIGRKGGKISRGGGFAVNRELAVEAGRKGGKSSRRTKPESTEE